MKYIQRLASRKLPGKAGNKAQNLWSLQKMGFRIPATFACSWEAHSCYQLDRKKLIKALKDELTEALRPGQAYAVRSSANIEDSCDHSFAGQFQTALNVCGVEAILAAMEEIWATTASSGVQSYLQKREFNPHRLRMAVLIQEMVPPLISGVVFSRNPLTAEDEVVIEAVEGNGAALVQDGVTPLRWINRRGAWVTAPAGSSVPPGLIEQVAAQTRQIAAAFHADVDLEWVFDGKDLYWVQLREISSLYSIPVYSNRIAKEMLPGLIKPLIFSVNVPSKVRVMARLVDEVSGQQIADPDGLVKSFYHQAYFNMAEFNRLFIRLGLPPDMFEMMLGVGQGARQKFTYKPTKQSLRLLPHLLRFVLGKLAIGRQVERFLAGAQPRYGSLAAGLAGPHTETALLEKLEAIFALDQEAAYYNIIVPLLASMVNRMLMKMLQAAEAENEILVPGNELEAVQEYNPSFWLRRLKGQYLQLDEQYRAVVLRGDYEEFLQLPGIAAFQAQVQAFLGRFGSLSDSTNDFSATQWQEQPGLVLKMVAAFPETVDKAQKKFDPQAVPFSALQWLAFRFLYRQARRFRLYRDQVGSTYIRVYGLFRGYFLALAGLFVQRGALSAREDIFYLTFAEVKELAANPTPGRQYAQAALRRRLEMEQEKDILLPETILGEVPPPLTLAAGKKLTGTPTSGGLYRGPVCVVRGIHDFAKVQAGDVLVIPYSDVGWTPLFSQAGAVIAESGGMLSHSSIIAREYGIPSVVSVLGALNLQDGERVSVDGFNGEITLQEDEDQPVLSGGLYECSGSEIAA